jgi:hypothetical protein
VLRKLSLPQRVVVVIALGAVASIVAIYVAFERTWNPSWMAGPSTSSTMDYFIVHELPVWRVLVLPIALVVAWAGLSLWVLAPPRATGDPA